MFGSAGLGRGGRPGTRGVRSWKTEGGQKLRAEVEAKSKTLEDKRKFVTAKHSRV